MPALHYGLDLYFAAILGISGLAKAADPSSFAITLRRQRILPIRSIATASNVFPWVEVVVAVALLLGVVPVLTAALTLALFVGFLIVDVILLITKRVTDCGCYGSARKQTVGSASVMTASVLVALAALHVWTGIHEGTVGWLWRLPALIIFWAVGCWLGHRVMIRRRIRPGKPPVSVSAPVSSSIRVLDFTR